MWRDWNFAFELDQIQASLYLAFDVSFATYFQETKIDDVDVGSADTSQQIIA